MKTIMIIDDEPGVLDILGETLGKDGYEIIPSPDAESALDVIRQGTEVDLVITDNLLPGMQGAELLDELRHHLPSVPVIMVTGHGSVETYIRSMTKGLFEYIAKPVRGRELRRIVKAALDGTGNAHPS